jgi:ferredoxin
MRLCKLIVSVLFLSGVTAAFFAVPFTEAFASFQFTPALISAMRPDNWLDLLPLAGIVALTLLFGRIYCKALCPLGILQSLVNFLFHPKSHVRRVCTRLAVTKKIMVVKIFVLAIFLLLIVFSLGSLAGLIDPYSIFGKALTLTMPWALIAIAPLVIACAGKGRIWCNYICPVGTALSFVAKYSLFKDKIAPGCSNCKACFASSSCVKAASKESDDGVTRREAVKGFAAVAALEAGKTTDGGFAPVSLPGKPKRPSSVLPPGSGKRDDFYMKCIGCQLCAAACPEKVIKPSTSLASFGRVELDFREGYCRLSCTKCGNVCPTGAISKLQKEMRAHIHMGHAIWKKDLCVRTVNGDNCTACIRKCPVQAIHLVQGFPVVDKASCIGCGACEHVCPSRPMPAIFVKGFDVQRHIVPMGESDLLSEMQKLVESGESIVVARHGVIIAREKGRGLKPAMNMLDAKKLSSAVVFDKIVGRAAAAIFIEGGVKKVAALVMSAQAKELLSLYGVESKALKVVDQIENRSKTGTCPMESAIEDLKKTDKIVEKLRKVIK